MTSCVWNFGKLQSTKEFKEPLMKIINIYNFDLKVLGQKYIKIFLHITYTKLLKTKRGWSKGESYYIKYISFSKVIP